MKSWFLVAAGCALMSSTALAQNAGSGTTRVVTFGDAMSDAGNLFATTGTPVSPPYNQRFSNGQTFPEYLNGPMQLATPAGAIRSGNVNFAYGNARTDSLSVTANSGIPGVADQINTYLARGGAFGTSTLVTYSAGTTNLVQGLAAAPGTALLAQTYMNNVATLAAANVQSQLGQLAGSGARTIAVYNLADMGALPAYNAGSISAVSLANYSSTTYNSLLNSVVQSAAGGNPATNFIQVDVNGLMGRILANPVAWGFTNVTASCMSTPSCSGAGFATQNQYLFWDGLNPTAAGQQLISTLTSMYLYAPALSAGAAVLADTGYWSRRGFMLDTLDSVRGIGAQPNQWNFFVAGIGQGSSRSVSSFTPAGVGMPALPGNLSLTNSGGGMRVGAARSLDDNISVLFNVEGVTGSAQAGYVTTDATNFGLDVAGTWRPGAVFVNLGLGGGFDRYSNYHRRTLLAPVIETANTGGSTISAAGEFGVDMATNPQLTVTPLARLAWLSANVNAFSESGLAAVSFGERSLQAMTATAELRFNYAMTDTVHATALVGYEGNLARSSGALNGQLINNTAQAFSTPIGAPTSAGLQVGAGLDFNMGAWSMAANYRGAIGARQVSVHRGSLNLSTHW